MNILTISFSDIADGASRAAFRMHEEFSRRNINSRMLVGYKLSNDEHVSQIVPFRKGELVNKLSGEIFNRLSMPGTFYLSSIYLRKNELVNNWADIILFRNIHGEYLSEKILSYLSGKVPVVWRLADMWAFTGHCAYSYGCDRWKTGCGNCPYLNIYVPLKRDSSAYLWKRKKRVIQKSDITIVTPSLWLKNLVEQSPIFKYKKAFHIASGVDLSVFKPVEKGYARTILNIPENELVLMFSSVSLSDKRKGGQFVTPILKTVVERIHKNVSLLVVGNGNIVSEDAEFNKRVKVLNMGSVYSDYFLSLCYNASDIFILPTLADNLPNTLIEASACGIPSVAFDVGGCGEAVIDGYNGFLADSGNIDAISSKIVYLLENKSIYKRCSNNARQLACGRFGMDRQIEEYMKLFAQVLK